jgi:hypothetical protein
MHDYAIFGHDRVSIGRWLGIGALLIAGWVSEFLIQIKNLTGYEAFGKVTVTIAILYFILHWIFNTYMWKIPLVKLPDLNGKWNLTGTTLNEDGSTKYTWHGTMAIEQSWEKILIHVKTDKSESLSYTATLSKREGALGGWRLSYSYKSEPNTEQQHELKSHNGYCEIKIDNDLTVGDASYFNNNGRRTFGIMKIEKVKND